MSAPIVPGDRDMPEWWTAEDDAVLAGELAKLENLPRPAYIERRMHELTYVPISSVRQPRSWMPLVVAVVLLCLLLIGLLIAVVPSPAAGPRPVVTPSTYGWPGPGGGRP